MRPNPAEVERKAKTKKETLKLTKSQAKPTSGMVFIFTLPYNQIRGRHH